MAIELRLLSSLEKTMPGTEPAACALPLSGFMNERLCFQLAWRGTPGQTFRLEAEFPLPLRIRRVLDVPVGLAIYDRPGFDPLADGYLACTPGHYPDLLREMDDALLTCEDRWQALWIDVPPSPCQPGEYAVSFRLVDESGACAAQCRQTITRLPGELPPQRLIHTKWFHADCLASYYGVEAFSEEHWRIIGNFLRAAAQGGITMTLMPIHTPPLDTEVGGERLTVQLVDVTLENGQYRFGMEKVRRWIHLCRDAGMTGFEAAHLYTQWGAKAAPKIMATVDGRYRRIFGWDTPADSPAYRAFLESYIPALRECFREEGMEQQVVWHISDEPGTEQLPSYLRAKAQVAPLLEGCVIRDALSSFDFYRQGVVDRPIVAVDHITPFLDANTPDLWAYYCCVQISKVSNQFIALPSRRNRVLALQLFKHRCTGFLHWGFNFYNNQYSRSAIDPYAVTDAGNAFPSGDPFQVYPGKDGQPEESIRMAVTALAMQDLRALDWLAALIGHDEALRLAEETLGEAIAFDACPQAEALLHLREEINRAILQHI